MSGDLPSGTVVFLFTDIEGSTPLWEREPKQMHIALERHHAILHAVIRARGGHVYKIVGDSLQAAFDSAEQALQAAIAGQRALTGEGWPTSSPIRVRMGLHVGDAAVQGSDYITTHTLNRVARIMSTGHGGQILLSDAVAVLLCDHLPSDVILRNLGDHQMKGMTQPEHLFQVVVPDLPSDFPPLNSFNRSANNLPVQLTPLSVAKAKSPK